MAVHRTSRRVAPGQYFPLGATLVDGGANFALYSKHAREVFVLLFDAVDGEPTDVIRLEHQTRYIWHAWVAGVAAGQLYGYKVCGDYRPEEGLRFNDNKLLLDPYAKAVSGKFRNRDAILQGYQVDSAARDLSFDTRDDSAVVPKGVVVDDAFDWRGDTQPQVPLERLVLYEVHLKGFTAHASSRVAHPGTYLGFIEKIPHLVDLGVNAVEFLPLHEGYVDDRLVEQGLTNYWGYNSIGFFAPESSYAAGRSAGAPVAEFKTLVRELHAAGMSVILDVVYNHTGEGSELGPTMSFRGIDNPSYYCLTGPDGARGRYYSNYTGCGNSLNFDEPAVIRLVMDSLRYWVEQMHVDGFRFDLASVLGRAGEGKRFQASSSFFDAMSQDPVLCRTILIAEPWDVETYEVGNFPIDWSEWNGRFRDSVRRFVKGDAGQAAEIGCRLTGSADLYGEDGRSAYNSINFITCHDGFTLNDLVSYDQKHNQANGEGNRDGANDNHSWNCGAEGPTDDAAIARLRRQLVKNHACILLFACGTPMILGGDEILRTQQGNNNAYCQDNQVSWFDWDDVSRNADILRFFRQTIRFVKRHPILQRRKFFLGRDLDADSIADLTWFSRDLGRPNWQDPELRTICYQLDGGEGARLGPDYLLFVILNAHYESARIELPPPRVGRWSRVVDTSLPSPLDFMEAGEEVLLQPQDHYWVSARSTVVLSAS